MPPKPAQRTLPTGSIRQRAFRLADLKWSQSLRMLIRRKELSFGCARTWSWTRWVCRRRGRWRRSGEIRPLSRKETLEDARAEIRLRRLLIRPDRDRNSVISIVQL